MKNQTDASENGIYVCNAGAWSRSDDFSGNSVTSGAFTFIEEGSTNADAGFVLTTDGTINLGTTDLTFSQFSGAGQITAGSGLTKTANRVIEVIEFCWKALDTRVVSREECQWKVIENIRSISSETENR